MRSKVLALAAIAASATILVGCSQSSDGGSTSAPTFSEMTSQSSESTSPSSSLSSSPSSSGSSTSQNSSKDGGKAPSASKGARIDGNKLYVSELKPGAEAPNDIQATFENLKANGFSKLDITFNKDSMNSLLVYPAKSTTVRYPGPEDGTLDASVDVQIDAYDLNGSLLEGDRCKFEPRLPDAQGTNQVSALVDGWLVKSSKNNTAHPSIGKCDVEISIMSHVSGDYELEIDFGMKGLEPVAFIQPVRIAA